MIHLVQVTIGAGPTQVSSTGVAALQITIQNNATHSCRAGDSTTTTTKGILLAPGTPGGALTTGTLTAFSTNLSEWWIAGTQNDVIDIMYVA